MKILTRRNYSYHLDINDHTVCLIIGSTHNQLILYLSDEYKKKEKRWRSYKNFFSH